MGKIVSNILIVSLQLIVGGLFLYMLFFNNKEDSRITVVENDNLDKMADVVSGLFEEAYSKPVVSLDEKKEEELIDAEAKRLEEEKARQLTVVDASGYVSKPAMGFNVTTDNKTYSLSDEDFSVLAAVVSCEANKSSRDDILAVMSVILNRTDSSRYPNDPVSVVAAPYQFSCYTGKGIKPNEMVASVMNDALNGVRNNDYYGFRSWQSVSYSDNYIIERGNRYS